MENCSAVCTSTYRYVLLPGNNHPIIRKALVKRKNWVEVDQAEILSAHFAWTPLNLSTQTYRDLDQKLKYEGGNVLINHFENNSVITTKSGLLRSLKHFYTHQENIYHNGMHVFESTPTTFIVQAHNETQEFRSFAERFNELQRKCFTKEKVPEKHCKNNVWIVKPEAMNQGRGIEFFKSVKDIQSFLATKPVNSNWIVQKCIERPLLYNGRKFDIRMWVLVTPQFDIYYYKKAYMRTSSYDYDPCRLEQVVQLTNNCYQKKTDQYQKFEQGNTLPISRLTEFLKQHDEYKNYPVDIEKSLVQRMKQLILASMMCARKHILKQKRQKEFQLFGYDFLIDEDLRTWLIEVNNNPYLGTPNAYMRSLVPVMIDEMFNIVLDNIFPPEVAHQIPVDEREFCLIHSEPVAIRRIRNQHSLTKNYYPIPLLEAKPNQILKAVGKSSEEVSANLTDRQSKMKYMSPSETIKHLLENYYYSDFDPFELPVAMLLSSSKLSDPTILDSNIKSLKLITDTRISPILAQPKGIQLSKKILRGAYPIKIKQVLLQGFKNCSKYVRTRKRVTEFILPEVNKFFFEDSGKQGEHEPQFVSAAIRLCINLAGTFQRKVFVPGQTRQNEFVRQFFIRQNGLRLINMISKNYPEVCKEEVASFISTLQDKDWDIFKEVEKGTPSDDWQKKYKGSSILREESVTRQRRSMEMQQFYSPQLQLTKAGLAELAPRSTRVKTSLFIRTRKSTATGARPSFPTIRK